MINVSLKENADKFGLAMVEAEKCQNKVARRVMEEIAQLESDLWFDMADYDEMQQTLAQTAKDYAPLSRIKGSVDLLAKIGIAIDFNVRKSEMLKGILEAADE